MKKLILSYTALCLLFVQSTFGQMATKITQEESDRGQEAYATTIATEAYLYGLPMMLNYRWANVMNMILKKTKDPNFKVKFGNTEGGLFYNKWIHVLTLPTHDTYTTATPNDDTNYSIFFADLQKEPVIITVPPITDRYYSIALGDAFVENTDYIGTRMGDKKGGTYALVGPNYKGTIPKGVKVFKMRHQVFAFVARIQARNPNEDLKKAVALQSKLTAQSLSKYLGKVKEDTYTPLETYPNPTTALDWYAYLFKKLEVNRPIARDTAFTKSLSSIGVKLDGKLDINALPEPVKRGLEKGFQNGKDIIKWYMNIGPEKTSNNWFLSFDRGTPGYDYLFRAYYSQIGMYTNVKEEASYPQTIYDSKGEKLNGKYKYQMTIPKDKVSPVNAFWSIITYKESDFVANKYYHYSVGDDKEFPVKKNTDGSVTLTFSKEPPADGALNNWLATPADDTDFRIVYRMYMPKPETMTPQGMDTFLPPVVKVD
jgi:DNA sulfur modification protein DndE